VTYREVFGSKEELMTVLRISCPARLVASILVFGLICSFPGCGGGQPAANPIGIFVSPRSAVAWSNSAEDEIVYKVVVGYSDGRDVPLTSGITWSVDQPWVWIDSTTATATCEYSAPQVPFFGPEAATITATAAIEGQTFSDSAVLDCF
jgi:hypothetical protein